MPRKRQDTPSLFPDTPTPPRQDAPAPPPAPKKRGPESLIPRRRKAPAPVPPSTPETTLTVSALAALIDDALRAGVPRPIRVVGEITGFNDRTHWWFSLKDDQSVVSCVMFASSARAARFRPENGTEVVATGRIEHYAQQGRTQLYVDRLEPVGAGALELEYRRLVAELKAEGYFDEDRKRALPVFPRRVAVVTSRTGAALQDVLDTMKRRCPSVEVLVVDVLVQGARAAPAIASALERLSRDARRLGIDAIVLTRGGGSLEDLWAFNERAVADAVLRSSVPVVAAVGHETDVTIAELVADVRAATPTQAAMRVTPDRDALLHQLDRAAIRLRRGLAGRVDAGRQRLLRAARSTPMARPLEPLRRRAEALRHRARALEHALAKSIHQRSLRLERLDGRLSRARPESVLTVRRERLNALEHRLHTAAKRQIEIDGARAESLHRQLRLAGPMNVLQRGFSITLTQSGRVVQSPWDVAPGESIETRLARGAIRSTVDADGQADPPKDGDDQLFHVEHPPGKQRKGR